MQHILVLPMSNPRENLFPLLYPLTAKINEFFAQAWLGVDPSTTDPGIPFYQLVPIPAGLPVGEQFKILYEGAANASAPEAVLHLCFIDRLAFALQDAWRKTFLDDLHTIVEGDLPLLFLRSTAAWETHPRNYKEIEGMATQLGRWVLGETLDFTWCHLVMRAGQLSELMHEVHNPDLSMMAEMVLQIHGSVKTKEVDWLAWEDPFILGRDAADLKRERELSRDETRKRLGYILPTLQLLCDHGMGFFARLQAERSILPPLEEEEDFS